MLAQLFALALSSTQTPTVDGILAHVRKAVGSDAISGGYRATGTYMAGGTNGELALTFTGNGRYLFVQTGRLGQTRCWDGSKAWETDSTGAPIGLHLSELQYQNAITWTIDGRWLAEDGPMNVTMGDVEPGGDSYTLNLKQKEGSLVQTVVVDSKTWMPRSTKFSEGDIDFVMNFSDWKDFGGTKFPTQIDTLEGELKGWFKVDSVSRVDDVPDTIFARPDWNLSSDTTYDDSKSGVIESKRAMTGHLLVHPTIDGKDVGWFILDSGAGGMAIDPEVAKSLGANLFGELNLGGIGGVVRSGYFELHDFSLGPVTVKSLNFISVDLKQFSKFFGVDLAGIVGYDFFRRAVMEIDVASGRIAVFDPKTYSNESAEWAPLLLDGRHPTAVAEFEGDASGRFRIDTGATGTVTFNTPTVKRQNFLADRETSDNGLAGVGGAVSVKMGKLKYFDLGGNKFENLTVNFGVGDKGIFAEDFLAGNIGQDLLKPFRLVFDYDHERLAFVKLPKGDAGG